MKKLIILILVLFAMSEMMFATSSNNYLLDSIVRVEESTGFVDSKKIYEYHANGTKSHYTAFNAWWSSWKVGRPKIFNNKSTFVYDEEGNELDYFSSVLDTTTGIWKDTHHYLYDERHNRVCGVRKWNDDSTVVLQGSHYYYDEDNFQIGSDQFDTWNGVQVLDYKCENTKDAHGNKIIMVEYSKPENVWDGDYMSDPNAFNEAGWVRIDSVYYTYNEKQEKTKETIYRWDNENQEWKVDGYQIFEYDEDGRCIADTVFARDFETNIITYNNMTANTYDSHGKLNRIKMYMPNFTDNGVEWVENGMYAYDYTYDENGEILQLRDYIDWQDGSSNIRYYTSTYYYSEHPHQENPTVLTVSYQDKDEVNIDSEDITLHLPEPPVFSGFTFLKWQVVAGDLTDGITIHAVYTANTPTSAPEVVVNPANPAQKLIRNGNVYILTDSKTYTVTGQEVR